VISAASRKYYKDYKSKFSMRGRRRLWRWLAWWRCGGGLSGSRRLPFRCSASTREVEFAAEGFYVGLDLSPLEIHFLAGVVDEGFGEGTVKDEGADHVPVAEDLEDVGSLLVAFSNAVDEFGG
jgi:hypothetical protein